MKMCRKAGKRADEVLEEDIAVAEEDIDIVGVEKKEAAEEERRMKAAVAKVCGLYGPQQFTEADVAAAAAKEKEEKEMEQKAEDDIAEPEEEEKIKQEEAVDQTKSCSQCQGGLGDAVVSLVCWHVTCRKCWLRKLARKEGCGQCGRESQAADLRRVFL